MSQTTSDDPLLLAWTDALPAVLGLLDEPARGLFRQEIQRFCALRRFDSDAAGGVGPALAEMLVQAARTAGHPAAIHTGRGLETTPDRLEALCHHILAGWRDAETASPETSDPGCRSDGKHGEPFFGPRLGGEGRPGALQRDRGEQD